MNEIPESDYGTWIRSAREAKGLSLQQVSEAIRIDVNYLRALETGNIALLPEPYMRAFLKTYSAHLGLNTEEASRRFETFLTEQAANMARVRIAVKEKEGRRTPSGQPAPPVESHGPTTTVPVEEASRGRGRGLFMVLGVLLLFGGAGYGAVVLLDLVPPSQESVARTPVGPPPPTVPEETTASVPPAVGTDEGAEPVETATRPPTERPISAPAGRALFQVEATEEVWIQAVAGGDTLLSRVMAPGQTVRVSFTDTLFVKMGKNRGARLYVDGKEITDLGPSGYVLSRLVLTRAGIVDRRLGRPPDTPTGVPPVLNIPPHR